MELISLALLYVPYLGFLLIAIVVAFDAQVRFVRPNGSRLTSALQVAAGLVMGLAAVGSIAVSPEVGLFGEIDPVPTGVTVTFYAIAAAIGALTMIVGLVRPARPHPRRGLTTIALFLDLAALAICLYYLFGPREALENAFSVG